MSTEPAFIGRYQIEATLGRGAMGVVYRAHDPEIDRRVAIKLIRADLLDGEERVNYIARFRREAQAAGRCTHPNIVTIYDFATHEGNPFLAMEFVDGASLSQVRPTGKPLAEEDAIYIMLQVLDALATAHAMGVVHRDIKPANILLVGGSRVKVTDFGISRFDTSELTQEGAAIGTPSYMSPEQCRGDPVDARSDLFSTGSVLHELLSGERAFAGRNFMEITRRVLNEEPTNLAERGISISPALQSVLSRALSKSVEARFASATEMSAALRAAIPGGANEDRTIILPRQTAAAGGQNPGSRTGTGGFDQDVLNTLERRLAHYVGPIARYLVQNAIRQTDDIESLCASLASNIEHPSDRDAFCREVLQQRQPSMQIPASSMQLPGSVPLPAPALRDEDLQRVQHELARFVGPVARVLVKREAAGAATTGELWQRLALHIDNQSDRRAFLAREQA
jgi:eukaryotic-like serine/threonine-protein kinase